MMAHKRKQTSLVITEIRYVPADETATQKIRRVLEILLQTQKGEEEKPAAGHGETKSGDDLDDAHRPPPDWF